jgi:hypothetical protein
VRGKSRAGPTYILGDPQRESWLKSIRSFVLESAASRFPRLSDKGYVVIKELHGSIGAPLLSQALPESRLVVLVRDPRDVAASSLEFFRKKQIGWASTAGEIAEHYLRHMGNSIEAYKNHPGPKALIKYEDLREDTQAVMERLYSELEIPVNEEELARVVERHSWESLPEEKKGEGKFYRSATSGAWRKDLSSKDVRAVEEVTAPILREFYPD